jgi:hypothetical protein
VNIAAINVGKYPQSLPGLNNLPVHLSAGKSAQIRGNLLSFEAVGDAGNISRRFSQIFSADLRRFFFAQCQILSYSLLTTYNLLLTTYFTALLIFAA